MLANDMKQGQTGTQVNGWKFEIMDNKRGIIRLAKVYGFETEIGWVYVHDIDTVDMPDGSTEPVEFTPAQAKKVAKTLIGIRLQTALIHRQQKNWRGTWTIQSVILKSG